MKRASTWGRSDWRLARGSSMAALLVLLGCGACGAEAEEPAVAVPKQQVTVWERADERAVMVSTQIANRGVNDPRVLAAMRTVPRHRFVHADYQSLAYSDSALPLDHQQTISQPYIVAFMTEALKLRGDERVLEIGTGSGYQAAVLAALGCRVFSIEIVEPLARRAEGTLEELGYAVAVRTGDGYRGWPEEAPFDAVIVTAAPDHVPQPLIDQLAVGGRMIVPVGDRYQELVVIEKTAAGVTRREVLPVRFVPMTGEARERRQ